MASLKPCAHPGCGTLLAAGVRYCDKHRRLQARAADEGRLSAHQRGYTSRWQKARELYLQSHPLCVHCKDEGVVMEAAVVDHKIPHKGDWQLFWDSDNWQPLCKKHHDRKTATEDGGWGRPASQKK